MEKYKEKLLNKVKAHIDFIREKVRKQLEVTKVIATKSLKEVGRMRPEDQMVYMNLKASAETRVVELAHLESSPYFIKCEIIDENKEEKNYFFSKHQFSEESIYSWVAPVASIRFENPGKVSYLLPDGTEKKIVIKKKEQYMIVDGKIIFFALEDGEKPRELIYQEHFTRQKSEFALPEIVAQIEKAQDQVIRANHKGPLIISGPAGSGKTTLALHRVAYLTQAPDTAIFYPPRSIIVFVQDNGTKEYFSTLLPGLGINDVEITTFNSWAMSILGVKDYVYIERYGETEEEKDLYEYKKLQALRGDSSFVWNKNTFITLNNIYSKYLFGENLKLFNNQRKEKKLDRFDLVVLLRSYFEKYKKFETKRGYQTFIKDKLVKKISKNKIEYSLIIVDEFQNYLKEQLDLIKNSLNKDTESVIYVGDIAQQVKLGTIKKLEDVGIVNTDRNIRLNKVYRNTKNILSFVQNLNYKIEIPVGLKEGPIVIEKVLDNTKEEIEHIKNNIFQYEKGSIGILSKNESYLLDFKKEFNNLKNIHILSMLESQGVEFDIVFIVGLDQDLMEIKHITDVLPEHLAERQRMQNDLLYVALTRAITELHLLGKVRLKDTLNK